MTRVPKLARLPLLAAWLSLGACAEPPASEGPPLRSCEAVIWAQAKTPQARVELVGSWNDWATPGTPMATREDGWRVLGLELPPGEYGYLIVEGGAARRDPYNPLTTFRADELEVSRLELGDCRQPALRVDPASVEVSEAGQLSLAATFEAARPDAPEDPEDPAASAALLDPASVSSELRLDASDPSRGRVELSSEPLPRGRHSFTIEARDTQGRPLERPAKVSVFVDPIAETWADAIVYQILVDRFYADGGAALDPPATPAARAGGTLAGVQAALEAGYFEALGVSALWLLPVYQNPDEARLGVDGRLYESYHGYWVTDSRSVDARLGGEPALRSLIAAAHARGVQIILDVVPNHVYETHAIVTPERFAEGWFNEHPQECVCGTPSCPWSAFQLDCWFAPYLPDIRVEHPPAMDFAVGELLWWLDEFEVDGLRIDAVPMMPRAASRRIAHAVREHSAPGRDRLLLGEVFVGGGPAGVAGLAYFLGPDGLDSVFDFPLMWALREVLASESAGFTTLDALLDHTDEQLAGSGAVLGRMLGNHDVLRFCSAIVGDGGFDPWDDPASQPSGELPGEQEVLDRVALGLTLQLSLPGMPVLYYGDELALAGSNDPDNRRVMPSIDSLSGPRQELLAHAQRLGQARRCLPALRTGARQTLHLGQDTYAFERRAPAGASGADAASAVVLVSRADDVREISLPGQLGLDGAARDLLSGVMFDRVAGATLTLEPRSSMILIPEDHPCAL